MDTTQLLTEALAVAADGIHSAPQSTSEKLTGAVSLATFPQVLFIVDTGTLGASGTLDFQVKGATSAGGTYAAIAGTAITQLVKASNDNQYALDAWSPVFAAAGDTKVPNTPASGRDTTFSAPNASGCTTSRSDVRSSSVTMSPMIMLRMISASVCSSASPSNRVGWRTSRRYSANATAQAPTL